MRDEKIRKRRNYSVRNQTFRFVSFWFKAFVFKFVSSVFLLTQINILLTHLFMSQKGKPAIDFNTIYFMYLARIIHAMKIPSFNQELLTFFFFYHNYISFLRGHFKNISNTVLQN